MELKHRLEKIFNNDYPGTDRFIADVIEPIFGNEIEYIGDDLAEREKYAEKAKNAGIKHIKYIGDLTEKNYNADNIALLDVTLDDSKNIERSRVSIQQLIRSIMDYHQHLMIVFHYEDVTNKQWRFSYAYKGDSLKDSTSAKRYTYVFGKDYRGRTAAERFQTLADSTRNNEDFEKAFSVAILSDDFFKEYREKYADFVQYITGKRFEKIKNKWEEVKKGDPNTEIFSQFNNDDKRVRDYIKKMLGRLIFLCFLQRKGWMNNDRNFLQNLYQTSPQQDDFLDTVLEPLFFGVLNTPPDKRKDIFAKNEWNIDLADEWNEIPYLNGGLFEQTWDDKLTVKFPKKLFQELFKFLGEYNFTIDENDPDDAEIGIDPEMLGRVFESLLEDNKDKGAFYTPKEIVQYMCRQSIIEYLKTHTGQSLHVDIEDLINKGLVNHALQNKDNARTIHKLLKEVTVCDPAIGSGAFPMGILNILFTARQHLYGFLKESEPFNPLEVKKNIIRDNIYGVDIEQGAVDIARLRFWLAILVEEQVATPLPNLDYRIVRGNSLITTFNDEYIKLPENPDGRTKLAKLKKKLHKLQNELFDLNGDEKFQREIEIKCKILEIIKVQLGIDKANAQEESRIESNIFENIKLSGKALKKAQRARAIEEVKGKSLFALNNLITSLTTPATSLADRAQIDIKFFDWEIIFSNIFNEDNTNCGFDIVIGNPPYIDSETMTAVMPELRTIYAKEYSFAKGNWDIYIVFFELGLKLLSKKGVLSFIVPNKWLSIGYGRILRVKTFNFIQTICDCRGVKVFEAGNEPIISIMSTRLPTKITIGKIHDGKQITHVDSVEKGIIDVDNIGICISPEIELLLKIKRQKLIVTDLAKVENPFSTSEAYELIPIIRENPTATNYRLINTGTVDPYVNYWGHTKTVYLKNKYDYPQIDVDEFTEKFPKRVRQTIAPKIIISGMRHFESYFDSMGKYVAGKSTIIVLEPSKKNNLVILQGIFNSKLMKFYIYQSFSTLGIGGGINFSKDMVANLPIPQNFEDKTLINAVYDVISAFKSNSETQIYTLLNQIDHIVYHLYDLSYDEVLVVDPQTQISRKEYESFNLNTYGQS